MTSPEVITISFRRLGRRPSERKHAAFTSFQRDTEKSRPDRYLGRFQRCMTAIGTCGTSSPLGVHDFTLLR